MESAFFVPGDQDVLLKAGETGDFVTLFIVGMTGLGDLGEAEGAHDFAELHGGHVLGNVGHPNAHGGVDGEIFDAGKGLAVRDGGDGRFGELEDVGCDEAGGAICELPLAVGGGHGKRG